MLPRKNGKTELAAALAIYGLLSDGEMGGEVYSAAADRDQAGAGVRRRGADDPQRSGARRRRATSSSRRSGSCIGRAGSFYRAISAEAYSKHGFNASMVIYDELHAAPTRELWDVLATSMGARAQPLLMAISTAGYDRHSILWELYAHAKKVQENPALDPTFLPILYEAPAEADWTQTSASGSRRTRRSGDFRSLEEMRIAVRSGRKEIPAQENTFRRLYLNQWTEQAVALDCAGGVGRLPGADRPRGAARAAAAMSGWTCARRRT